MKSSLLLVAWTSSEVVGYSNSRSACLESVEPSRISVEVMEYSSLLITVVFVLPFRASDVL